MASKRIWALTLLGAACTQRTFGEGVGRPGHTTAPSEARAPVGAVVLSEVFLGNEASAPWVELANPSASPQSVGGAVVCAGAMCYPLPTDAEVPAGAAVVFFPTEAAEALTGDLVGSSPVGWLLGDVALFDLGTRTLSDPEILVSFVRIDDSRPLVWVDRAVAATPALWPAPHDAVALPADPSQSLKRTALTAIGAAAWVAGIPEPRALP